MALSDVEFSAFLEKLRAISADFEQLGAMDDHQFRIFAQALHASQVQLKKNLFVTDYRNQADVEKFEYSFGAQSAQFIIDIVPYLHQVMLQHYRRSDELTLVDVGPGSCIGTNLLASLHSDDVIYSKLKIDAIDYTNVRERWATALYPKINYRVEDLFDQPDRQWDFVICSHVIEHLDEPRPFIDALRRICKGFAFIYSPFEELDRIPYHLSTITRDTYAGIDNCRLEIRKSMGWRCDLPGNDCILAIIDCR